MKARFMAPFLLTDAPLATATLLIFRLDHIVNSTLYEYGLLFNTNWAIPYWTTIRLTLTLITITIILTPAIAYLTLRHTAIQTSKTNVYVCITCKTSWSTINKIRKVHGQLPQPQILKTCPTCNQNLLDQTTNKTTKTNKQGKKTI